MMNELKLYSANVKPYKRMKSSNKELKNINELSVISSVNLIDDLVNISSHFELHTLAAAIYASTKIELIDSNYHIEITEKMLVNQSEKDVIKTALDFIKIAQEKYETNKDIIDTNYSRHIN